MLILVTKSFSQKVHQNFIRPNFRTTETLSRRNFLETQFFAYFSKFELLTNARSGKVDRHSIQNSILC